LAYGRGAGAPHCDRSLNRAVAPVTAPIGVSTACELHRLSRWIARQTLIAAKIDLIADLVTNTFTSSKIMCDAHYLFGQNFKRLAFVAARGSGFDAQSSIIAL